MNECKKLVKIMRNGRGIKRLVFHGLSMMPIGQALDMKRIPCYKTIQNTMRYLDERFLSKINILLVPSKTRLAGIDSSGVKTHQKRAWVVIRFGKVLKKVSGEWRCG